MIRRPVTWWVPAAGLLAIGPVHANDSDAARCAGIADDGARLSCYDAVFRPSPQAAAPSAPPLPASTAPAAAAASAVAAAPSTPEQDFGLTPARKEQLAAAAATKSGAPTEPGAPTAPESVTAKVATVAHRPTGELVVILDNGQVWVQIDTETKNRLKEGDTVTIRKASLGSFFLVTPGHILIRVRRVQ